MKDKTVKLGETYRHKYLGFSVDVVQVTTRYVTYGTTFRGNINMTRTVEEFLRDYVKMSK